MSTLGPTKPTLTYLMAALARKEEDYERAHTAFTEGPCRAHEIARGKASDARHEAKVALDEAIAARTGSIITVRAAIEWIEAQIKERAIPGLVPGLHGDRFISGADFCAAWTGCIAPEYIIAEINAGPVERPDGRVGLYISVEYSSGSWGPDKAIAIAKQWLAIAELAREVGAPWVDRALELDAAVSS